MTFLRPALLAATLCLATPVLSQALEADAQTAMEASVNSFNSAFSDGDIPAVMAAMPPKIKTVIAESAGVSVEELDKAMIEQTEAAMAEVNIESFGMDIPAATYGETSEGRAYALIPTVTVIDAGEAGKFKGETATLTFEDDGEWYLVRIDDANQVALLNQAYPEFAGVEFPTGSMTQVTE